MSRSTVSQADQLLIAGAARQGYGITARQIERWREQRLLPANVRRALGRGKGSASEAAPGASELVVWLAQHARPGRRPGDLALRAFGAGLAVPESTVRAAFTDAINRVGLAIEPSMPPGSTPEDVADAAVAAGLRATLVPARIRRIDQALARAGVNWAARELTSLDLGFSPTPTSTSGGDWTLAAVQMLLAGGSGIDLSTMGSLARAMHPAGAAAPLAGQMEYGSSSDGDNGDLFNKDGGLAFLPTGDMRDYLRDLAASTPLDELLAAWRMAAQMPEWATSLCDAVEREVDARTPGTATREWILGSFGPPRMVLTVALRGDKAQPAGTASTTLILTFIRNMIRDLRKILPAGNFDLLKHPVVTPPFLVAFMDN